MVLFCDPKQGIYPFWALVVPYMKGNDNFWFGGIYDTHFHGILSCFDLWRGKEGIGKYICYLQNIIYLTLKAFQGWRLMVCFDWVC